MGIFDRIKGIFSKPKFSYQAIHEVELIGIKKLNKDVYEYTFKPLDTEIKYDKGQYISIEVEGEDFKASRPYSIISTKEEITDKEFKIVVERAGLVSSYLQDNARIGNVFKMTDGYGNVKLVNNQIVIFASGVGIAPYLSLFDYEVDLSRVVLFYIGNRVYERRLNSYQKRGLKVINIIEESLNIAEISKHCDYKNATIYACGSNSLYTLLEKVLSRNDIVKDYPATSDLIIKNPKVYNVIVHYDKNLYMLKANSNETIMTAFERSKLGAMTICRAGVCGFCRSKLIKGEIKLANDRDELISDYKTGYIHPCSCYPLSDLEIEILKH